LPQSPLTRHNLTSAVELLVELAGKQHARARAWFSGHFDTAVDIGDDVGAVLAASWVGAQPSAMDLYFKVAIEYFRDVVEPLEEVGVDDNPLLEHLTDFQSDAYVYARTILRRYGGVFLADVVGLGKTFIALALLSHFQRRYSEHAVVIAPPAVLGAWQELAKEHRVELACVSIGRLEDLHNYSDREILVIDESHNFRNSGTQRHNEVQQWLRPGGTASSKKVILLSATPQNNRPEDVKHQMQLFPDNYMRLPYRGESLDGWFRSVAAGQASLVEMLQHVVVRRTRRFIQHTHPNAQIRMRTSPGRYESRPLRFPRRVSGDEQTLRYSLDDTYGAALYNALLLAFKDLKYPLHGLSSYVLEAAAGEPAIGRLRRGGTTVRGLFKVLLLKRLESSVVSLHSSLERLRVKLVEALASVEANVVVVGASQLAGAEEDGEVAIDARSTEIKAEFFDKARLRTDIEHDLGLVDSLCAQTSSLIAGTDAKIARLRAYLKERSPRRHRTLIFTQFADTAKHLRQALGQEFGRTEVVIGGDSSAMKAAKRFAPKASRVSVPEDEQIDLLISTDALSEGVNLQDADTLINYDIHWNPVRLIQRAGRIDRIGSEHDEIHVSSFLPERLLEAQLGLEAVLRRRIQEFISVFGEDSYILPAAELPTEVDAILAYTGGALEADGREDNLDGLSRHAERLLRLRRESPDEYTRILQMRPGLHAVGGELPSVVAMRRGWYWTFWTDASKSTVEQVEVLKAMDHLFDHGESSASKVAPIWDVGAERLALIESARGAFEPLAVQFAEQRSRPRLSAPESFALQQLDQFLEACVATQRPLVQQLRSWIREGHGQEAIRRAGKTWKLDRLAPNLVFEETRSLFARFPPREENLGMAEMVAAVFKR
jgi:superfamily II DNA or RNA helicase